MKSGWWRHTQRHKLWVAMVLLTLTAVGCRHRDLCYPTVIDLRLVADWSSVSEPQVKGLTAYFYPVDRAGDAIRWDFKSPNGGQVRLAPGEYRVVCFNNNSEILRYRGEERYETIESFTSETRHLTGALSGQLIPRSGGSVTHLPPEPFYAGRVNSFRVGRNTQGVQEIVVPMAQKYIDIEVELQQLSNLDKVVGFSASLSGVASSYLIGLDQLVPKPISTPLTMQWEKEAGSAKEAWGRSTTYGVLAGEKQILTLYVVMRDGVGYLYHFDVTDQVVRQKDSVVIKVVIDDLIELPDAEIKGSGMQIEVEDWVDILVDIKM